MNDEEFVEQRRLADLRRYMIGMLDPGTAPRLAPAAQATVLT